MTSILAYISFKERPLSLSTNPNFSKLKNFKVKLLANELPTYSTLHSRNPTKYNNYLCSRCLSSPEDNAHLISCLRNATTIDSIIRDTILAISEELEILSTHVNEFTSAFKRLHIQQKFLLGFITTETLAPFERHIDKMKYVPLLHHLIIKLIYHKIWLLSRQITHSSIFPTPNLLLIMIRTQTAPLS